MWVFWGDPCLRQTYYQKYSKQGLYGQTSIKDRFLHILLFGDVCTFLNFKFILHVHYVSVVSLFHWFMNIFIFGRKFFEIKFCYVLTHYFFICDPLIFPFLRVKVIETLFKFYFSQKKLLVCLLGVYTYLGVFGVFPTPQNRSKHLFGGIFFFKNFEFFEIFGLL